MVSVQKLTPETFLSHPRRSPAVPNASGTIALYTASTHSFATGKATKTGHILPISPLGSTSTLLWEDEKIHDAKWLPGSDKLIVYLRTEEKGEQTLRLMDVEKRGEEGEGGYEIGKISGPVSEMKLKKLDDGQVLMVAAGQVGPDGALYNKSKDERKHTGQIFDTATVRVWNQLYPEYRSSLWYTTLKIGDNELYTMSHPLFNLLAHHKNIDAPFGLAEGLMDGASNFDISKKGVAFAATIRQKVLPPKAGYPSTVFFVSVGSFQEEMPENAELRRILGVGEEGMTSNVRLSPDERSVAFLNIAPPSIVEQRMWIVNLDTEGDLKAHDVYRDIVGIEKQEFESGKTDVPGSFEFTGSSDAVIIGSDHRGRGIISSLKLAKGERPKTLTKKGSVSAFYPVNESWDKLIVSSSSFTDSSLYEIVEMAGNDQPKLLSSSTRNGKKFGLNWDEMVEEIEYEGADGWKVQCWMIKPMGFDKKKRYPWIFLPHGGPESAWADAWSTRWNMAVFAELGYVVVLPNITGSVGFGLEFCSRIHNEWGGRAFVDLLRLLDYCDNLPYLDPAQAVLAGASYSGYLVNWFMGQDVIKRFCGAVCHSPVFNIPLMNLTSDFQDFRVTFDGPTYLWETPNNLDRHNPSTPERLANWKNAPPTLMIHAEKDYRCPITEGLAAFRVLQAMEIPSRFLTFPDECHWVEGVENARFWWENVSGWMQRCVKGEIKRGDRDW